MTDHGSITIEFCVLYFFVFCLAARVEVSKNKMDIPFCLATRTNLLNEIIPWLVYMNESWIASNSSKRIDRNEDCIAERWQSGDESPCWAAVVGTRPMCIACISLAVGAMCACIACKYKQGIACLHSHWQHYQRLCGSAPICVWAEIVFWTIRSCLCWTGLGLLHTMSVMSSYIFGVRRSECSYCLILNARTL